jgi:hypothetical protein
MRKLCVFKVKVIIEYISDIQANLNIGFNFFIIVLLLVVSSFITYEINVKKDSLYIQNTYLICLKKDSISQSHSNLFRMH